MTTQQLEQFFRKKAKRSKLGSSTKMRQHWIRSVGALYRDIESEFLASLIKDNVVIISRRPKTLFEEALGEYKIDDLIIKIGDEVAVFSPKGRLVVGAQGRLDLEGNRGVVTFVLNPERWSIVVSRSPTLRVEPVTEHLLLQAVKDVMRV